MAAAIAGRAPRLPGLGECSLVELQLGFNGITDNGADKLGEALQKKNHVTELGLPGNDISRLRAFWSACEARHSERHHGCICWNWKHREHVDAQKSQSGE